MGDGHGANRDRRRQLTSPIVAGINRPEEVPMKSTKDTCAEIAKDMSDDATNFDGQPFTGRTVAEYFGNHGAAIAALANILATTVNEDRFEELFTQSLEEAEVPEKRDLEEFVTKDDFDERVEEFLGNTDYVEKRDLKD